MQELTMSERGQAVSVETKADSKVDDTSKRGNFVQLIVQLFHLALAAGILLSGFAEFSVEPTIFDVFGAGRSSIPREVFKVTCITCSG